MKDLKKSINEIVNLDMTYFRYQLNRLDSRILTNETHGPRVTSLKIIRKISPQGVRSYNCIHRIPDAAWHFSSMGGAESVLYKHRSFSHFYEISESFFVGNQNKLSLDMLNRYPAIPVDNFFPTYVIHNREYFQKIGFLAEVEETWKDDVEKAKRDLVWARGNKEYPYEWE